MTPKEARKIEKVRLATLKQTGKQTATKSA